MKKSDITRKDVIGWSIVVIIALSSFVWSGINTWGTGKINAAIERADIKHRLDSLCKDGIKKDIRDNTQDIAMKDFQQTVLEYIDKQDKRDAMQQSDTKLIKDDIRLLIKIADKTDKRVGAANDLIEELKERQEARDILINANSDNLKPQ